MMQFYIQIKNKFQLIMHNFFSLNMGDFLHLEVIYQIVYQREGKSQLPNYFNKVMLIIRKIVQIKKGIPHNC